MHRFDSKWLVRTVSTSGAVLALAACMAQAPSSSETTGASSAAVFSNGDFETPASVPVPVPSWNIVTGLNNAGVTQSTPQTLANLKITAGGRVLTSEVTTTAAPLTQKDSDLASDNAVTFRWPRYGHNAALVNDKSSTAYTPNAGKNVNELSQQMTVTAADVDPTDNQVHVRFVVAPILQNPAHTVTEQPYYFVSLTNDSTTPATTVYTDFNLSAQGGVPWKASGTGGNEIDYLDWTLVDIPANGKIAVGNKVTLTVIAAGCQPGGHFGKVYLDGVGTGGNSIPGLFVSGSGPSQANAGSNITYTFTYDNASGAAATGVTITIPIPTGTTFQSDTLPAGVTCTPTIPVGGTGTLTCTVAGTVAVGGTGSISLTVKVNAATTGTVTEGSYNIKSDQETILTGNKVETLIGCTADAQCVGGMWCNIAAKQCLATVANGSGMPTDTGHTTPTINGTCNDSAAALVCTGKTCETSDNDCGHVNGHACTAAAGCRTGICDPADSLCGYKNGDGPCTVATQTNDCRTGSDCSASGVCKTSGTCTVDGDCGSTQWCKNATHLCVDRIDNAEPVPTDASHTPTLDGTCTTAAANAVCKSKVCDTSDNDCGYKDGDGPCDSTNGGTVCRSGSCSTNGLCRSSTGCNVDADCTGGDWCNEAAHTCSGKLANGSPMPTDTGHTTPTLNGTCNAQAAALVCGSGVCDSDNKCGYENDHGPCSADAGAADAGASASVCRSGVCDGKDDKCGYASGDGPCTPGDGGAVEACRSNICASDDRCADCLSDKDCPTDQTCRADHTCSGGGETDGGVADGGISDAGKSDGGNGGSDAAVADAGDDGSLQGGGCAMTTSGTNGDSRLALFGIVTALGLVVIRRRRNAA